MTANTDLSTINHGKFISSYDKVISHVNWREALTVITLVPSLPLPSLHWPIQQTYKRVKCTPAEGVISGI